MEQAEKQYWYWVVYNYMEGCEDWRYPDEAVECLLAGTHNQEYITDQIKYPVLRWRELNKKEK
jgi:hypothetical protein